jgi:hypothetical protein
MSFNYVGIMLVESSNIYNIIKSLGSTLEMDFFDEIGKIYYPTGYEGLLLNMC